MGVSIDDFLPTIFRQRRPRQSEFDPNLEKPDPALIIKDEWGGPSDHNILSPSPVGRMDAPASVKPVIPLTDTATPPIDPTAANVGQDYGGTGLSRQRRVETDEKGRPIANTTMQGDAQTIDLNQRIHNYQPQAAHGWWDKWGKEMVTGAVRGLAFGPGGVIEEAARRGITAATNPEQADERWKAKAIAESDPEMKRIAATQAAKTKMAQEVAQTAHVQAQTEALKNPKPKLEKTLTDNGWALLDTTTGKLTPVIDPKTNKQAQGRPTGAKTEWVHDENGIAHKYENGKDTGQLDPGRNLKVVPGYGLVPPGQAMNADATAANREDAKTEKTAQTNLTNSQLEQNIADAQAEQKKLGDPPAQMIEGETALGVKTQVRNPLYDSWERRYRELDDKIRGWRADKKAAPTLKPSSTSSGRKYTVDPKFLQ